MSDSKIPALLTAFNVFNATHGRSADDRLATFLASLAASGYAVVPVEATEKMIRDGTCVGDYPWDVPKVSRIWSAMLAAAQEDNHE